MCLSAGSAGVATSHKCQQSFPEMMPGCTNKSNTTRSLFDHQQPIIKQHLRCPIIVLSESSKPPLVSRIIMSNISKPTLSFNACPGFTGQSSDTQHAMKKQSHAVGLLQTWQLHQLFIIKFYRAQSRQHRCFGKNSPGQRRGPKDPLTKRVSLPAHRELSEDWWLG